VTFDDARSAFLVHLRAERRCSDRTVTEYGSDVAALGSFTKAARADAAVDVRAIDLELLRAWLGQLSRKYAASSLMRKVAAVRTFMRWLRRRDIIATCPADQLATPKVRRGLPTLLSVDAAKEVVETADPSTPMGARDRAVLELLYGSGLRVSELCGLDLESIDLVGATARVLGKGRKERIVPLGGPTVTALRAWLQARPGVVHPKRKTQDPKALLLTIRGARILRGAYGTSCTATARPARDAPICTRTRSGTHAPPTCSMAGPTFGRFRSCSDTPRFRRRSGTPTSRWPTCCGPTMPRTQWLARSDSESHLTGGPRPSLAGHGVKWASSSTMTALGDELRSLVAA
jgi:integrase/recombinase XerC